MTPPRLPLAQLMNGQRQLILLHNEKEYLLSITRRGKLILTAAGNSLSAKND